MYSPPPSPPIPFLVSFTHICRAPEAADEVLRQDVIVSREESFQMFRRGCGSATGLLYPPLSSQVKFDHSASTLHFPLPSTI